MFKIEDGNRPIRRHLGERGKRVVRETGGRTPLPAAARAGDIGNNGLYAFLMEPFVPQEIPFQRAEPRRGVVVVDFHVGGEPKGRIRKVQVYGK